MTQTNLTNESVTDLVQTLTNSAIGYEYAKTALDRAGDYGHNSAKLKNDIETFKKTYFLARNLLEKLDSTELHNIEEQLVAQREEYFSKNKYLN